MYWISNYGRIYSSTSHKYKKIVLDDRNASDNYYIRVALRTTRGKDSKYYSVHRLVMVCFNPDTYGIHQLNMQVNHKDGNKENNYYNLFDQDKSNLEWQSASDNVKHAFRNGLNSQVGQMNSSAKLNELQVLEIRDLLKTGLYSDEEISKIIGYDCNPRMIQLIRYGKTWNSVKTEEDITLSNQRIFTDEQVHMFCKCFVENKAIFDNKTVVQLCRETLTMCGLPITNENLLELRLVYRKLIYKHITTTYNY